MISLKTVSFRYDGAERPALGGIDLEARAGAIVCVAGMERSGKTTLFRLLNGTAPRAFPGVRDGTLTVGGLDPAEHGHSAIGALVTSVFDDPDSQIISLTVEEEVAFALVQRGVEYGEIRTRVAEALDRVGLSGFGQRATGSLSGGQKQRLIMASAIALRPKILLVDEGTSALDPEGARHFFALVREMTEREGTAAIVIERDLELMLEYADEILVLHQGLAAARGTPAEIAQNPELLSGIGLRLPAWLELCCELKKRGVIEGAIPASEAETLERIKRVVSARRGDTAWRDESRAMAGEYA